jgi:hypothetical protein
MTRLALALALLWPLTGHAADRPDKPDAWFCIKARMHRAQFATDKAAEDSALAQGASRADIAKAHRCKR